jgi:hypothetical protein
LRLPLPRHSILISVDHVLVDLQGLSTVPFLGNSVIPFHPISDHYRHIKTAVHITYINI